MPTRTLTFDVDELSNAVMIATDDKRDLLSRKLPLMEAYEKVHGKGGKTMDGGEKWLQPVQIAEHSVVTNMPTGFEEINLDVISTDRSFVFSPATCTAPIIISQREKNIYHGKAALFDRASDLGQNVLNATMRGWHKHSLTGGVAGFEGWATLNGIDDTAGYLEHDGVGTQGNTVGGLDKSSFSSIPGMQNWVYNAQGAVGQNGRAGILSVMNNIDEFLYEDGGCVVLASQAGLSNLQRVMQPYMRYTNAGADAKVDLAGPGVMLGGKPVRQTSHMPTEGTVTTASPLSILILDMNCIYPCFLKADTDGMFGMTDFVQHSGSYRTFVSYVECNGQWWAKSFHSSAVIYNAESF